jgi:hypothetical protein
MHLVVVCKADADMVARLIPVALAQHVELLTA